MSTGAKAILVLAILASAFTFLTWVQNRALAAQLAACGRTVEARRAPSFRVGAKLPAFTARSASGEELTVPPRHDGRSIVVFYGLADCPPCEPALDFWIELHGRLRELGSEAPMTGLAVGDPAAVAEHARARAIPFPVVAFPDQATLDAYGLSQLPVSAILDAEGRIEHFWAKTLGKGELADMIELTCPECLERALEEAAAADPEPAGD